MGVIDVIEPNPASETGEESSDGGSVLVLPQNSDATILHLVVNLLVPQRQIVRDFKCVVRKRRLLYRAVDPRLFEAVKIRKEEGLSYREASIRVFGTARRAEQIRNMNNKLGRSR